MGHLVKLFFETFGKIGGTGKTHFKGHLGDIAEIGFQELRGPLEAVGLDKPFGGFPG